jgi:hypothetical protein
MPPKSDEMFIEREEMTGHGVTDGIAMKKMAYTRKPILFEF